MPSLKIAFVSHCGLYDNSSIHICNIAAELVRHGHACSILLPFAPEGGVAASPIPAISYEHETPGESKWWEGLQPDLIHAWTPREHVRRAASLLRRKTGAPIVVHMEDNEERIIADRVPSMSYGMLSWLPNPLIERLVGPPLSHLSHPRRHRRFLRKAAGYTCITERLLEFKPARVPGVFFWPGFEPEFAAEQDNIAARRRYGLGPNDIVLVYSGNVHRSVVGEITELYLAVALLRRRGYPVKLVKTGKNFMPLGLSAEELSEFVIDLGFVERSELPGVLSTASILVQPGAANPFNDYRFPAKLPEYLASGRPVILPDTNIGRELKDGIEALKLQKGSSVEIADAVERLIKDPILAQTLGKNGRNFALKHLLWSRAADIVEPFYRSVLAGATR